MSHRVYIYNIATPEKIQKANTMLTEWGYHVPLLLQPLLIENGFVAGNIYNTYTEPENHGLYYTAQKGLDNMKVFYNFLEKHQQEMITDLEKFQSVKQTLFEFLDQLKLPYFHVDAWDVFAMSEESHQEQAHALLSNIATNNAVITKAIENDNPAMLDLAQFHPESVLGFTDFKSLLNDPGYNYGLEHIFDLNIHDAIAARDEPVHFEQNGLWGLKDSHGNIIVDPIYDECYGFAGEDLAVIYKDEKYGYLHKSGKVVIPPIYQDAYDFEGGRAIVKLNGKYGLINTKHTVKAPFEFESIETLDTEGHYTAQKGTGWGVIDSEGKTRLPFEYRHNLVEGAGFYHTSVNGEANQSIFNSDFKYIGEFPASAMEYLGSGLLVNPYGTKQSTLFDKDGNILEKEFESIFRQTNFPNALILIKDKKHGAIGQKQQTVILPYEYDSLTDLLAYKDQHTTDFILAQKEDEKGVFDGNDTHPGWLIPLSNYQEIVWLYEDYFALQKGEKWAIIKAAEEWCSDFEFDMVTRKLPVNGFAYAFKGTAVYSVDENEINPASKALVLEDLEDKYKDYYFNADIIARLINYTL